jgi:hypothetical protein
VGSIGFETIAGFCRLLHDLDKRGRIDASEKKTKHSSQKMSRYFPDKPKDRNNKQQHRTTSRSISQDLTRID